VRENSAGWSPFMAVPADAHVAIVLAGLGIAAAPLLKSTPVSLAPPTDDVDRLAVMFGDGPDLLVGFEPAAQEHYFLLSSSAHSLRRCLKHNPAFRALRRTFGKQLRQAAAGPSGPAGVLGAYPRQPGQRLSSLGHR